MRNLSNLDPCFIQEKKQRPSVIEVRELVRDRAVVGTETSDSPCPGSFTVFTGCQYLRFVRAEFWSPIAVQ